MAAEKTDEYRMLVSNLRWAVEENRRIEIIKTIRHMTGCGYERASDIHEAFTNFPREPSPMPEAEAELRRSLSPDAPKRASEAAAEYVRNSAAEYVEAHEEPTMADMLYSRVKSGEVEYNAELKKQLAHDLMSDEVNLLRDWVKRDNDEEPSPLPQGIIEYLVVTRDKDNNAEAFRYFNKTEAYEAAKAEHIYNTDIDVSIAQVIAIVDTTPYIREV